MQRAGDITVATALCVGPRGGVSVKAHMSETPDFVERLTRQLDRAAALRAAASDKPRLEAARQNLRAWQAARLARTHADLLASPSMGRATAFFLTDLYNAENLAQVGANLRRVAPAMRQLLPATALTTVIEGIELEALSEELDLAMATTLEAKSAALDVADYAASYAAAYRKVGRRLDRVRQIQLIEDLGNSLDRLVHQPLVGSTLSLMRVPARLAGLADLQDFLQRGFSAFAGMGDASEFLRLVVGRERRLLEALFAGDDSLLQI